MESLQISTLRELEDLIIDAMYLDILQGKLDQKEQQLEVEYTMGRDVEPKKVEELLHALQSWSVFLTMSCRRYPDLFTQVKYDCLSPSNPRLQDLIHLLLRHRNHREPREI